MYSIRVCIPVIVTKLAGRMFQNHRFTFVLPVFYSLVTGAFASAKLIRRRIRGVFGVRTSGNPVRCASEKAGNPSIFDSFGL
jgi:hypothetical protein